MKYDLTGKWSLSEVGSPNTVEASIPGSNYSALLAAGVILNPYYGTYEDKCLWVAEKDWEFSRAFTVDERTLKCQSVMLVCKSLDTLAEIFINGQSAAKTKNAHIGYRFEVKPFLKEGENVISVIFKSPLAYVKEKQKSCPAPNASMGVDGVPHIRKPQCHFGWDWGPILPISGITGDIYLEAFSGAQVADFDVEQVHGGGVVTLNFSVKLTGEVKSEKCILLVVTDPDGEKYDTTVVVGDGQTSAAAGFTVENPQLWYTRDLSGSNTQPLYEVEASIAGTNSRVVKKTIGLRTVTLSQQPDKHGRNFRFSVNGAPIFAKGANWIPQDALTGNTKSPEQFILAAARANFNMIRVWGGGYYESDAFYSLCDKYGILVWQDLAFACAPYPFWDGGFLDSVKEELAYNVTRLKSHPCLALWCGNNEIEMMTIGWALSRQFVEWTDKFFHNILPPIIKELDPFTPFIDGSPTSSQGFRKNVNGGDSGDSHLWHVWHGLAPLDFYATKKTRFCSEFGFEALPDRRTVAEFCPDKELYLTSPTMKSHQKCNSGNEKMLFYASTRFRLPKKFDDLIYLSGVTQTLCVENAVDGWRAGGGVTNGALFWQFNDTWPVVSWSSLDSCGRYKPLMYRARHFFEPFTLVLKNKGGKVEATAVNDTLLDKSYSVKYYLSDFGGNKLSEGGFDGMIPALSALPATVIDLSGRIPKNKNVFFYAEMTDGEGNVLARKTLLFDLEKNLTLPAGKIALTVKVEGETAYIELLSDKFKRYAFIREEDGAAPLSDNCFDLLPGVPFVVTLPAKGRGAERLEKELSVISVAEVEPEKSRFCDFLTRQKIRLKPINIANYIYYKTV